MACEMCQSEIQLRLVIYADGFARTDDDSSILCCNLSLSLACSRCTYVPPSHVAILGFRFGRVVVVGGAVGALVVEQGAIFLHALRLDDVQVSPSIVVVPVTSSHVKSFHNPRQFTDNDVAHILYIYTYYNVERYTTLHTQRRKGGGCKRLYSCGARVFEDELTPSRSHVWLPVGKEHFFYFSRTKNQRARVPNSRSYRNRQSYYNSFGCGADPNF